MVAAFGRFEHFQRHTHLPRQFAQASVRPFPRRQISLSHHVIFFGSANAFREPHQPLLRHIKGRQSPIRPLWRCNSPTIDLISMQLS